MKLSVRKTVATAVITVALGGVLVSCSNNDFKLSGQIDGADSKTLVLERGFNGQWIALDSAKTKSNGDFTDCPRLYGLVIISMIKFLDLEKTPLPPPAIGFAVISDLSPAGIEKARAEALRNLEQNH